MFRTVMRLGRGFRSAGKAVWVSVVAAGVVAGTVVVVDPISPSAGGGGEQVADGGSGLTRTFGAEGLDETLGDTVDDGATAASGARVSDADEGAGKKKSWVTEIVEGAASFAQSSTSTELSTIGTGPDGTEVARPGQTITWTTTYTPSPGSTATDVKVRDLLPDGHSLVGGSLSSPPLWDTQWSSDGALWSDTPLGSPVGVGSVSEDPGAGQLFDQDYVAAPLEGQVSTASGGDGYTPIMVTLPDGEPAVLTRYHVSRDSGQAASAPDVFCVVQRTGEACPGGPWPQYLSSVPGPVGTGPSDLTGDDADTYVVHEGRVFYPAMKEESASPRRQSAGIGCFDYTTSPWTNCGYWQFGPITEFAPPGGTTSYLGTTGVVRVGNNIYSLINTNHMACLNIVTLTKCSPDTGFVLPAGTSPIPGWVRSTLLTNNNQIYFFRHNAGNQITIDCWNVNTQARCAGGWGVNTLGYAPTVGSWPLATNYTTFIPLWADRAIFFQYNTAGAVVGVCYSGYGYVDYQSGFLLTDYPLYGGMTSCMNTSGVKTGHRLWLQRSLGAGGTTINHTSGDVSRIPDVLFTLRDGISYSAFTMAIIGTHTYRDTRDGQLRTLFMDSTPSVAVNNRMGCFNWSIPGPCDWSAGTNPGFPAGVRYYTPLDGRGIWGYGFADRDNCIYGLNHAGLLFSMDAVDLTDGGGLPCRTLTQQVTVETQPSCATGQNAPWDVVRVTGFLNSEIDNPRVTIQDRNGNDVPGYVDRSLSFNGSRVGTLDISAIPATGNTSELTAIFHGKYLEANVFGSANPPQITLETVDSPMSMCFSTVVPNICNTVGTTIENVASLTGTGVQAGTATATMFIAANPACAAVVSITNTDNQDFTYTQAEGTYRITVNNPGPGPSLGTTVTDTLPDHVNLNGTPTTTVGSCSVAGKTVTCNLGRRNAGAAPVHIDIPYRMSVDPPHPGPIVNTAQVCHNETLVDVCHQASDSNPVRINRAPNGTLGPFRAHEYDIGAHPNFEPGPGMLQQVTVAINSLSDEDGDTINYAGATIVAGGGNPPHSHASIVGGQLRFQIPNGSSTQETVYVRVCDSPGARYPIPACRTIPTTFHINRAPVGDSTIEVADIPRTGGERPILQHMWDPNQSPDGSLSLAVTGGATVQFSGGGTGPVPLVISEPGNPYDGEVIGTVSINGAGNLVFTIDTVKRDADPDLVGPAHFDVRICDTGIPGLAGVACRLITIEYGFGAIGDKRPT